MNQASAFIFHRVYEVGFCKFDTITLIAFDTESDPVKLERTFSNVTPEQAVQYSLAEAFDYGVGVDGDEFTAILDTNGRPYVSLLTFGKYISEFVEDEEE